MADIPVYGMIEKLQRSYPERRDEFVDILGIDLNWRVHKLSDGQRRNMCAYSNWSDMTIKCAFIR